VNRERGVSIGTSWDVLRERRTCAISGVPLFLSAVAGDTRALCLESPQDGVASISRADQQRIARICVPLFFRGYLQNAVELRDYLSGLRTIAAFESAGITVESE
jgi:hypothetical protein